MIAMWSGLIYAQAALPLYSGDIPGAIDAPDQEALRDATESFPFLLNVSQPMLYAYPVQAAAPTPAVLIFPGGSYRGVSIEKEGHAVARAFNAIGVSAFVVKYRTPNATHMSNRSTAPLQDAQQAMRVVRARAVEWNVDTKRVGVVGFSAGGHVAGSAALFYGQSDAAREDAALRPDFAVLLYPVISMADDYTHAMSRQNLLGAEPTDEQINRYSLDLHVSPSAPPMFLMHAADDRSVKVDNTLRLFAALRAQNVVAELHVYPKGGHGFGLVNATTPDRWIERCRNWLVSIGVLTQ
jgi:acetyl esterase/lipase